MINIYDLSLSFGSQAIFDALSCTISEEQRIGLVGRNGSGKSTLLKAIAGQQIVDGGSIALVKDKTIAYLPQEVVLSSYRSILQETESAFAHVDALRTKQKNLEDVLTTDPGNESALEQYATVCDQLNLLNPDALQAEAKKMLTGLGFSQEQFNEPVSTLSVGWKMRIVLAKLLLQKADFYLFDEPTNHLDIVAKDWFLQFLKSAPFGFMIVSHERYFLDFLCTHVLELERGRGKVYNGNYSHYETQKEHDLQAVQAAYKNQQRELKQKRETIERFRAKASKAKMAQSMIKSLDKVDLIELPPGQRNISFNFPPIQQSGKIVLTVKNIAHAFDSKKIFKDVSFEIQRGQKVALVAPNGVGKTTLFNVIAGKLALQTGMFEYGYNVEHALFDQDQTASLDLNRSVFDNIYYSTQGKTEQVVRKFLGAFLFSRDDTEKKVKVLSGGEKNRVGMVRVLLQNTNLLLLDEPTNHLDIPSKETLLKALQEYKGTIIFVSHDHDFVNKLATDIIELTPHKALYYHGNYDSYKEQKKQYVQSDIKDNGTGAKAKDQAPSKDLVALKKMSKTLEKKIGNIEYEIKATEVSFAQLSYGTPQFEKAETKLNRLKKELEQFSTQWEEVQQSLE